MPRRAVLLAGALLAAQAGLLTWALLDKSDTIDEPIYLCSAAMMVRHHDYAFNMSAPVLPKWSFGLAMRAAGADFRNLPTTVGEVEDALLWRVPAAVALRNLRAARATTVFATLLGGLCVWLAARRFGELAGLIALATWCFSPTILGQGAQATLDGWSAVGPAIALLATLRALERPSGLRIAACGAACGIAAGCKLTAGAVTPFAAVAVALAVRGARKRAGLPWRVHSAGAVAVLLVACVITLWAPYGFVGGPTPVWRAASIPWFPLPYWLCGVQREIEHGYFTGHTNYLLGELRDARGFLTFYVASLALRTTLGAQMLVAIRVVARAARGITLDLWQDAALLAFPVALGLALSLARTQLGMRYLLPAFPCTILWCSRAVADARRLTRKGPLLCVAAALLGAVDAVHVAPHFIMYYNAWAGGPDGGDRYLLTEQGQDKLRLAKSLAHHPPIEPVYYLRFGSADGAWGLPPERPPPCVPTTGTYALHLFRVHRGDGCLDWLTLEPPDERLGHSIYLYRVDAERVARLLREAGSVTPFFTAPRRP
jgi:hypothetical protein